MFSAPIGASIPFTHDKAVEISKKLLGLSNLEKLSPDKLETAKKILRFVESGQNKTKINSNDLSALNSELTATQAKDITKPELKKTIGKIKASLKSKESIDWKLKSISTRKNAELQGVKEKFNQALGKGFNADPTKVLEKLKTIQKDNVFSPQENNKIFQKALRKLASDIKAGRVELTEKALEEKFDEHLTSGFERQTGLDMRAAYRASNLRSRSARFLKTALPETALGATTLFIPMIVAIARGTTLGQTIAKGWGGKGNAKTQIERGDKSLFHDLGELQAKRATIEGQLTEALRTLGPNEPVDSTLLSGDTTLGNQVPGPLGKFLHETVNVTGAFKTILGKMQKDLRDPEIAGVYAYHLQKEIAFYRQELVFALVGKTLSAESDGPFKKALQQVLQENPTFSLLEGVEKLARDNDTSLPQEIKDKLMEADKLGEELKTYGEFAYYNRDRSEVGFEVDARGIHFQNVMGFGGVHGAAALASHALLFGDWGSEKEIETTFKENLKRLDEVMKETLKRDSPSCTAARQIHGLKMELYNQRALAAKRLGDATNDPTGKLKFYNMARTFKSEAYLANALRTVSLSPRGNNGLNVALDNLGTKFLVERDKEAGDALVSLLKKECLDKKQPIPSTAIPILGALALSGSKNAADMLEAHSNFYKKESERLQKQDEYQLPLGPEADAIRYKNNIPELNIKDFKEPVEKIQKALLDDWSTDPKGKLDAHLADIDDALSASERRYGTTSPVTSYLKGLKGEILAKGIPLLGEDQQSSYRIEKLIVESELSTAQRGTPLKAYKVLSELFLGGDRDAGNAFIKLLLNQYSPDLASIPSRERILLRAIAFAGNKTAQSLVDDLGGKNVKHEHLTEALSLKLAKQHLKNAGGGEGIEPAVISTIEKGLLSGLITNVRVSKPSTRDAILNKYGAKIDKLKDRSERKIASKAFEQAKKEFNGLSNSDATLEKFEEIFIGKLGSLVLKRVDFNENVVLKPKRVSPGSNIITAQDVASALERLGDKTTLSDEDLSLLLALYHTGHVDAINLLNQFKGDNFIRSMNNFRQQNALRDGLRILRRLSVDPSLDDQAKGIISGQIDSVIHNLTT